VGTKTKFCSRWFESGRFKYGRFKYGRFVRRPLFPEVFMPKRLWSGSSRRLIVLNVALLAAVVGLVVFVPAAADASDEQPVTVRPRGEYTMVSGKTNIGSVNAVYILDAVNQEMVALRWDPNKKTFAGIGYRNLEADAKALPGR